MNIRIAEHVCLQPCSTGYHVTLGRRFVVLDMAGSQLIAASVAGNASSDDIVRRVAAETGESPEKLQQTMKSLLGLGILVSGGGPLPPPKARGDARTLPESEIAFEPLADLDAVLRCGRQTLLRPVPDGFQVWSPSLRARVILEPGSIRLLPLFAPPGNAIAKVVAAASSDGERQASHLATISRCLAAGVLLRTGPAPAVKPAAPAPEPAPKKARALRSKVKVEGKIPVYPVAVNQAVDHEEYPPLALGLMVAHAKAFRGGTLQERFHFVEDWLDSAAAVEEAHRLHGPGVFLFSSYIWCEQQVLEISRQVKKRDPGSLVIVGGPSAPKYEQACAAFFKTHPQFDVLVRGEGEVTLAEALAKITSPLRDVADGRLADVAGLSFRSPQGTVVRTPDRDRAKDLTQFPSPYLTGLFDDLARDVALKSMILETNRGCPYGCTFCDWGSATLQKILKFPMDRVIAELEWAGKNKIRRIWCADANFGIFDRDVEIAEAIVRTREKYGFPTQMTVNYAKNATERHAEILRVLGRGGVHSEAVLSIQSTSEQTLKTIRRQNIKTERYDELAGIFRSEDLTFASDLMIGLPGETVESFKASLQHFFDRDVYVQAYQTILLPNSPMADPEYIRANKIELVGNVLVGSYSYNIEDLSMMVRTARYYALMVNLSIMKYLLYHLQNDRGLRAVDVLARMVQKFEYGDGHTRYPLISWLLNRYRSDRSNLAVDLLVPVLDAPSSWDEFFLEVRDFVVEEFGVAGDAALETALAVQAAVMPREGEQYPLSVELKHDFVRYLEDHRAVPAGTPRPPLSSYPPGRLVVTDPAELSKSERPEPAERDHVTRFELQSGLPSWTVRFPAAARPAGAPAAASAPAAG